MDSRTDCTGASTRAKRSVEKIRYTETDPAADDGDGHVVDDLDALLGEVEVAIRASKGQKTEGKRRPRSLREVRAVLQGIRDGKLLVEPVRADEPGSRRRGRWADEDKVSSRPAWAKARIQSAMGRHFKITGLGTSARLVWWHLWSRGSGVQTDATGRSVVEVGMVHAQWLADETGLGERTVRRALVELEEAGMIARRRTFRGFKYRVLVPAALLAEIAGMSGQSGPSGQDMSLASGQDMSLATGHRVSPDTSESSSDPPSVGSEEDGERTAAAGAGSEEPPRSGEGSESVCPIALRRSMLVGAGVWPRVAETVASLPGVVAMPVEDLRAEIALAREEGAAPGALLVARLKNRDRLSRRDRGAKTKPAKRSRPDAGAVDAPAGAWAWCSAEEAAAIASDADRWAKTDEGSTCWSFLGDTVHLADMGLDEAGSSAGFRDRIADTIYDSLAGDPPPEAFVEHAVRIVEADPAAFEAFARSWRSRIEAARQVAQVNATGSPTDRIAGGELVRLAREAAISLGDWFKLRWRRPPAPKRDAQAPAVPVETPDTRRRCPSDVRPQSFLLYKDRRIVEAEVEAAKAAGSWNQWTAYGAPHKVEIKPGCYLDEVVARAVESQPDAEHVARLVAQWENAARADKHERRVVLAVLTAIRDELARRRRLEPPTRNPVEVLRALQATGDPPIARIADGEVVEAGENLITTRPRRSRTA